jgi:5-methylcytosine-specific restriction protein B
MIIKPSENFCSDYDSFSKLAHESGEPIYLTKGGEGDLVLMSIEAFEKRENEIRHNVIYEISTIKPENSLKKGSDKQMSEFTLGKILRDLYDSAQKGEQVAMIHLFSISYANEMESKRLSKKEILKAADLPQSYLTEIAKGIRLKPYVTVKEEAAKKILSIEVKYK